MLFSWLRGKGKSVSSRSKVRRRPRSLILRIEPFEERVVPSATLVRDINTNTAPALAYFYTNASPSAELNGRMYFFADDGEHGRELWSTDGTEAGTALVKDINPGLSPSAVPWGSGEIATLGNKLLFGADDGVHGSELWISDGTEAGTSMLKDIAEGNSVPPIVTTSNSFPNQFTVVGDKAYFVATDNVHGTELWVTDGTAPGTHLVKDVYEGTVPSSPNSLTASGDKLFFAANSGQFGTELWVSDGTEAGTKMVKDIGIAHGVGDWAPVSSNPSSLIEMGGKVYFAADDNLDGSELWVSDGTEAGTQMVKNINEQGTVDPNQIEKTWGSGPSQFTVANDRIYFFAHDGSTYTLWASDGTEAGTLKLSEKIGTSIDIGQPYLMTGDGATIFFAAGASHDGVYATQLWKSDGTTVGTKLLGEWNEPPTGNLPYQSIANMIAADGELYFTAGKSLGHSDGETVSIFEGFDESVWTAPAPFGWLDGKLLLAADDGEHGLELWRSDGTSNGTYLVKDINETTVSSSPNQMLTIGSTTYFVADDGESGLGIWKTDGTSDGTKLVKSFAWQLPPVWIATASIVPWPMGPMIGNLSEFNGELFFTANDSMYGAQLWRTDGTEAGTVCVTLKPTGNNSSDPSAAFEPRLAFNQGIENLKVVGDTLYFTNTGMGQTGLWKTDGTYDGTELVRNFQSNFAPPPILPLASDAPTPTIYPYFPSIVDNLTDVSGTLYFTADDGEHGMELWKSDGTTSGTVLVKDINSQVDAELNGAPPSSSPSDLTEMNGKLYFAADDDKAGRELWVSDGTESGTMMVTDIGPKEKGGLDTEYLNGSSEPQIVAVNGTLFFNADNGEHGQELWASDGTEAGTRLVKDIHPNGDAPLWEGTPIVKGSSIQSMIAMNGELYFTADDGVHGLELWKSNGTEAGTALVKDIFPGDAAAYPGAPVVPNGSMPKAVTSVDGTLYFVAAESEHGAELWKSDGTSDGTQLVEDVNPGPNWGLNPWAVTETSFAEQGDVLLFAAYDSKHGEELHAVATEAPPPVVVDEGPSAGGPYRVSEGGTLELHADPDALPDPLRLRYLWDLDNDGEYDDAKGKDPTMVGAQLRRLGLTGGPEVRQIGLRIENAAGLELATDTADLIVDDAPLTVSGATLDVTEGQKFNRNVASFQDVGGLEEVSHYTASIDWGDGKVSVGTIVRDGVRMRVAGAHEYHRFGTYTVRVSIQDDGGASTVATSAIEVHDAGLYAGRTYIRATAGRPYTGAVATFQDRNPSGVPGDFTAEINWGDGSISIGTIVAGANGYQVEGTHIYATDGDFNVEVKIQSAGGSRVTATSTAKIDPVRITPRGLVAGARVNLDVNLAVAAFRDADRLATASLFSAMIDWADGSTSPGEIESDGSGGFRVKAVHRYTAIGSYSVRVTIQDVAGNTVNTVGTVRVVG